jgi:uncharacterized cysteine cluster protein YcgN (CxxCxxCC family)
MERIDKQTIRADADDDWEALCRRCGRCCYEKVDFEGRIYYTELPCEFLDLETRCCRVYAERDVQRAGCVRLDEELVGKGFLPADCPYVADIDSYVAPIMSDDES